MISLSPPIPPSPLPTAAIAKSRNHEVPDSIQTIVRLDNRKSYVFNFLPESFTTENILTKLSLVSGLPFHMLQLHSTSSSNTSSSTSSTNISISNIFQNTSINRHQYFLSASTFLPIRGGKGGFGTLLKGQSKQAGAKRTLDFGACRDLNGRRLRHVNDEIKLRKWRESMKKKMEKAAAANQIVGNGNHDLINIEEELEELRTASGIRNWHLMVPNWSEVGGGGLSSKSRRSMERSLRREIEKIAYESRKEQEEKRKKKANWEDAIMSYANAATGDNNKYVKDQEKKMTDSILEGLNKRKKRKLNEGKKSIVAVDENNVGCANADATRSVYSNDDEAFDSILAASNICTLSGDIVLEDKKQSMLVQSKSEFATSAILLNSSLFKNIMADEKEGIYYEVTIKTCGIAQIGWASLSMNDGSIKGFLPNNDTGDGVGDDAFSYGFDGSRALAFHAGKTTEYGQCNDKKDGHTLQWKDGDVVGCSYNISSGKIEYSLNGKSLGVAFDVEQGAEKTLLHPVLSLNQTEIIELNTGPNFQYAPENLVAVTSLIGYDTGVAANNQSALYKEKVGVVKEGDEKVKSKESAQENVAHTVIEETEEGPINLEDFKLASELEQLGGDRLKKELFNLGCKCGGPVQERAKRLFATKGLKRSEYPKKILAKK